MNQLQVIAEEQKLAQENVQALVEAFGGPFDTAGEILSTYSQIVVDDESQVELMKQARENRLALKKVRTAVENKRKELKEDSLRTGKAIDGIAKYIKDSIVPAEEYLERQEKFAEIKEAERRLIRLTERTEKLKQFCDNPGRYEYLADMTDDEFDRVLKDEREAYELKKAQVEAYEREQERLRLEKEAEDARIREENEILRKQAAAREAEIEKEREAQELAHKAEVKSVEHKAVSSAVNAINAFDRYTVPGVNGGQPMIDYASVVSLLSN